MEHWATIGFLFTTAKVCTDYIGYKIICNIGKGKEQGRTVKKLKHGSPIMLNHSVRPINIPTDVKLLKAKVK